MRKVLRERAGGFTVVHMLAVICVILILLGMTSQGMIWVKSCADTTALMGRANKICTGLLVCRQQNGDYPSAYPAQLEVDLAPYIDDPRVFCSVGEDSAGVEVNKSYVRPEPDDPNSYVLNVQSRYDPGKVIVLFADSTADVAEKLEMSHNDQPIKPGTSAAGGVLTFAGGSSLYLAPATTVTAVQSFQASDGSVFHVVKVEQPGEVSSTVVSVDASIVEVATSTGNTLVRNGVADVRRTTVDGEDQLTVTTRSGEVVVVSAKVTERGPQSESDGDSTASGLVNVNPNNNDDFEFYLEKPDGTCITRDDLLASCGDLDYRGPAVKIRFKPKGNGNQNSLMINGEAYPLNNGTLYTITATEMTVHVYNDRKGSKGRAMGKWWLNDVQAVGAKIYEGDQIAASVDGATDTGYTVGSVVLKTDTVNARICRTLGRGSAVQAGWWAKAVPRR